MEKEQITEEPSEEFEQRDHPEEVDAGMDPLRFGGTLQGEVERGKTGQKTGQKKNRPK